MKGYPRLACELKRQARYVAIRCLFLLVIVSSIGIIIRSLQGVAVELTVCRLQGKPLPFATLRCSKSITVVFNPPEGIIGCISLYSFSNWTGPDQLAE